MITIIEHGKYRKITCSCGCIYSFHITDITEDGNIPCPECGALNTPTLKENDE